ncbi:hypothetical protein [Nocardioides sp. GY 10127]|uniref:hypothetical protein n=1 Tax=Nocardioides sp. GY 10127 TaxID=2569762 RepID=UPI0010A8FF62|nr:hypothetical protein [Nocardioides sp. GY 10127]TIC78783.1 hypothetical protein E8D37_18990 [Nocardioides sp. GY 10127]
MTAPLVQVATTAGGAGVQVSRGRTVPSNITETALAVLIENGYVEKQGAAAEPETPAQPAPGTVKAILSEVGDDPAAATAALDAEVVGENRATLVKKLQAIIDAADSGDDTDGDTEDDES